MKIVVDEKIPFIKGVLESHAEILYRSGDKISPADVKDADALIIRTRTNCTEALLDGSKVRFIATATIGFDHIDTKYCDARGITWTNAEGCNASSVQQYIASVLSYWRAAKNLNWEATTIGIIGVGNVGKKIERLCRTLGMRVIKNDPPRERREDSSEFVSLDEIIERSDVISLHVPLNLEGVDRTFHLVDDAFLQRMRSHQRLINSSRGEVVETKAVRTLLESHKLAGCVLDVWENEPAIDRRLMDLVDIATPHIAGYSADGKANGTSMSVQAVSRFFGLGLNAWVPSSVPIPPATTLREECSQRSAEDVISSLIQKTYEVQDDDRRLRSSPETFEAQRGSYPLRREFPTYTVVLDHASHDLRTRIEEIGFHITE
jgi:erythronate-4-phosphate dehydrogenase